MGSRGGVKASHESTGDVLEQPLLVEHVKSTLVLVVVDRKSSLQSLELRSRSDVVYGLLAARKVSLLFGLGVVMVVVVVFVGIA